MPPSPRWARVLAHWPQALLPAGITLLLVGYFMLPLEEFGPGRPTLSWTCFVVALVLLSGLLLREIRRVVDQLEEGHPAVTLVLLIFLSLVIFATAYLALAKQPGEFVGLRTRLDALYFTVITVSTVGYGDVTPSGQTARALVIVQIGYNLVFLATAASALSTRLRGRAAQRARHRHHAGRPPKRR